MNNDLLLLSKNDIPFIEAGTFIHNPTLNEISFLGEEVFFSGRELINLSKNNLSEEDKNNLKDKTDFDILIAILRERNAVMQKNRNCVLMLLALLFPNDSISCDENRIILKNEETKEEKYITNNNFIEFKKIFNDMFPFDKNDDTNKEYNPSGELAKKIADKLKKGRKKVQETKGQKNKKINILNRYISILAVGEQKNINDFFDCTVYQLLDEFKRYELKMNYDIFLQAKMAGAKDLKENDDWMQDIHE